jgi:hypothetical protein
MRPYSHLYENLIWCYVTIVGFENHQAINYYHRIHLEDFVSGRLHRPWAAFPLEDDLQQGCMAGIYEVVTVDDEKFVTLTDFGQQRLVQEREMLEKSVLTPEISGSISNFDSASCLNR